ncbi:MAG: hypothetical protein MUQ10_08900 [Anaerolineae bacterium]|nr:hypothetical protein [Anaerolineae bacterium]
MMSCLGDTGLGKVREALTGWGRRVETPGMVALFGSGETTVSAQRVYSRLFANLSGPVQLGVLETPAGFELNSAWVAGRFGR